MAADAGELKARATLDNTEFLSSLKELAANVQQTSQATADQIGSMSQAFDALGQAVAGLGGLKGIQDFISSVSDAAVQVGKLEAAFQALNGVTEETQTLFEGIHDLSLHSMFSLEDVLAPAAEQMLKLGVSATDTSNAMQALADAAAAMKQGPGYINEVSNTLANMSSHLVVTQRDMKALQQEGISGWTDLATAIGTDVPTAMEEVKKGMVSSQTVLEAVTTELETRFKGAAETTTTSWRGAMAVLSQAATDLKAAIGDQVNSVLNDLAPIIATLSTNVEALSKWIKDLSPGWKEFIGDAALAITVIGGVAGAITLVSAALVLLDFNPITLGIGLAVAALALIGKWVYDNWPAIKAVFLTLWDDIKSDWDTTWEAIKGVWGIFVAIFEGAESIFNSVVSFLSSLFSPLVDVWSSEWATLKSAFQAVVDWISPYFEAFINGVKSAWNGLVGLFTNNPVTGAIQSVSDAWKQGQIVIAEHTAEVAKNKKALDDASTAATNNKKALDAKAVSDKLAADQAAASAAAAKKAAEEAAKEAAAALKFNEDLKKTYDALYAIAPDVATAFSDMYGGLDDEAVKAQKLVGSAWDDIGTAEQQVVIQTLKLGDAFKTLGESSSAALQGAVDKAAAAYATISTTATSSAADIAGAFESVVAAQQKLADHTNNELKLAFQNGSIDAQTYYQGIVDNAQKAVDAVIAKWEAGKATETEVQAAEKLLNDARVAQQKSADDYYTAAINALGEQTADQLTKTAANWGDYAAVIGVALGVDSKQFIEASIKQTQALIDKSKELGQKPPQDLVDYLALLNQKLTDLLTPAEQFAADMKLLGVNTAQAALTGKGGLEDMAAALENAKKNADDSVQSQVDLQNATDALNKKVQAYVDLVNNQWAAALKNGDITQTQYDEHMKTSAAEVLAQFTALGDKVPGQLDLVNAAEKSLSDATKTLGSQTVKDANQAFVDLGVQSHLAMQHMKDDAEADFAAVAASANANGLTYMNAWINAHTKIYNALLDDGTSLSSAQKEDMAKMVTARDTFLADQKSAWGTAYGDVSKNIGDTFDALTKQVVTGDLSFGKLMTNMWQGLADTALNAFIAPLKKAVTDFISTELANLLGDKGLGGVLSSLTQIGAKASGLFPSGGGGGSGLVSGGGVGGTAAPPPLEGAVDTGATAGVDASQSGASSAAGLAGSLGSAVSVIGAAGAVAGAIAGAIGDIQNVHIEKVLGQIEENTRYSQLFLGGRADQGILGVLFFIATELQFGYISKAVGGLFTQWQPWSAAMLSTTIDMHDYIVGITAYVIDSKSILSDVRDIASSLRDTVSTGFQQLTVTINAGNMTTADAARQLGAQIAQNLSTQLTAIRG